MDQGDVRAFKKEIGRLLDDPFGVAERLDEFLGSSIYTFDDLMAILRSLFNNEEREMIKQAGIRDWDRRNPQGTPGDQKWPSTSPSWNVQTEDGRRNMVDLRNVIIQGIREAVPRGQNISKVFGQCQGKDESPTEWIERLRRSLQMYSGTDPNSTMGEVLLKTQFVAKSWEDIRRKLEKIDGWQDKSLQELLREAQKVYMRREGEIQKLQAKVLVAVKEVQKQEQAQGTKLLQYVDDLLVAGPTEESVRECTVALLNFLGKKGLKVLKSKLQFMEPEVKYLGHWLTRGKKKLDPERVAGIIALPAPKTKRQIRQILGLLGYCRQWIEGFSEKVKFLYERLNTDRVKWTERDESDFQKLKNILMTAPVLTFPDINKEFQLFVDVSGQTAQGVLTQEWAGKRKPIGFVSKILDPVSRGWPTCLLAIVAVALLVEEAKKTKVRPDLEDQELEGGEKWFIDGSAKVVEGKRKSGYAVVDGKSGEVVESGPLEASWSAQACELYALLRALRRLKGKRGTVYTDSRYAFGVVHTFGKIWEERGLINTKGKGLIHGEIIRQILEAIREPEEISVVHVKGHQTGIQFQTRGNNLADREAKRAALLTMSVPEVTMEEAPEFPLSHSEKETEEFKKIGGVLEMGKWRLPNGGS
ncbi:hypothetical protein HGM15179_019249 [Zosterops borbonicus]|uniref:ribonuclease H n=1 Tax=Zosterops borbonicus TaxID=364589 RepID=A0A8K1DB68_9PASS|nr:hypothetical protein HGM15179_019249 [Zosterops borbonicus]